MDIRKFFNINEKDAGTEKLSDISTVSLLKEIKAGNKQMRDAFIARHKPFIMKVASMCTGRKIWEDDDEFGIGMEAFNEAINSYDLNKKSNFFTFCELVIKRRIIDFIRMNSKNSRVFPFSSMGDFNEFESKYLVSDSHLNYENAEVEEDIIVFKQKLAKYGITILELAKSSPKHKDSRSLCVEIAKVLAEDNELYGKLKKNRNIPRNELLKRVNVHRRTIENNRKFIIAVCLILRSNLEISKKFFSLMERGGEHHE